MSSQNAIAGQVPAAKKSGSSTPVRSDSPTQGGDHGGNMIVVPAHHFYRKNDGKYGARTGPQWEMAEPVDAEAQNTKGWISASEPIQAGYEVELTIDNESSGFHVDTGSGLITKKVQGKRDANDLDNDVGVQYGDGHEFRGKAVTKTVIIGRNNAATINEQFIGSGKMYKPPTNEGDPWVETLQQILGLSPSDGSQKAIRKLSAGSKDKDGKLKERYILATQFPGGKKTLVHNLKEHNNIPGIITIHFYPYLYDTSSKVAIGGYVQSMITKAPVYTALLGQKAQSKMTYGQWTFKQKLTMGQDRHVLTKANAIVDTGASQLFMPPKVLDDYIAKAGATYNAACDGYIITETQYQSLPSLYITITAQDGTDHEFEYNNDAQIWPKSFSAKEKVPEGHYALAVAMTNAKENFVIFGHPASMLSSTYSVSVLY